MTDVVVPCSSPAGAADGEQVTAVTSDCGNRVLCPQRAHIRPTTLPTGSAGADRLDQLGDLVVDLPPFLHQRADLLHRVDHGGVVAAAVLTGDGGIAEVGELTADVHPDLASGDQRASPALALQ